LLFFLVGNFRVMLLYCDWKPAHVIIYKLVKIIGATFFLAYGTIILIQSDDSLNKDLFILWISMTCAFWT